MNAKRAGEDVFLIVGDVEDQFAEKGLRAFGVSGIKDAVAAVFLLLRRRGMVGIVGCKQGLGIVHLEGVFVEVGGIITGIEIE